MGVRDLYEIGCHSFLKFHILLFESLQLPQTWCFHTNSWIVIHLPVFPNDVLEPSTFFRLQVVMNQEKKPNINGLPNSSEWSGWQTRASTVQFTDIMLQDLAIHCVALFVLSLYSDLKWDYVLSERRNNSYHYELTGSLVVMTLPRIITPSCSSSQL